MQKTRIVLLYLCLLFFSSFALANSLTIPQASLKNVQFILQQNTIIIKNTTKKSINLQRALLTFAYAGNVSGVKLTHKNNFKFHLKNTELIQQSHNAGNIFEISIDEISPINLAPNATLTLQLSLDDKNSKPHSFKLFTVDRVPVQVKVTTTNANWVETISICNISGSSIPLNDVEFDFNYALPMPTNIWGQPWTAWKVASQQGSAVVLTGGTPWTPVLLPDPNCMSPLTIQFNNAPSNPHPTPPFVFKAAGATPVGTGNLTVTLPATPASGLKNPTVAVKGVDTNSTQTVAWGTQWKLTNLAPGSYTVTSSEVDDGQKFYSAAPITVSVAANTTVEAKVQYTQVPNGSVTVTFVNSPAPQEPITFTGQKYTFNRMLSSNTVINLPADTYTVSAMVPGYSADITPNPLVVPTNTRLTITYTQSVAARFVGYFESWSEQSTTDDAMKTNLANLPSYVNVVNLSFMKPDAVYVKGSLNYSGTGLEFGYPSQTVLKFAVAQLHRQNPGTKVLVAVGGAAYTNWSNLNARAIADFVVDYGLDGVDIDYEPAATGCAAGGDGLIHCQIDSAFQSYVESLRSVLPRPYLLTVTSYSVSAYGEGQWKGAQPQSMYTGMMLPLLRSVSANKIDMLNVMSYDAGLTFNPIQALAAYSNYYQGPISMGVEVPPEAWGGHVYTLCQVIQLAQTVKTTATQKNTVPAMMLWSIQKKPTGTASPTNPSAQMLATTICNNLGLGNCNQPLLINGFAAALDAKNLNCQ